MRNLILLFTFSIFFLFLPNISCSETEYDFGTEAIPEAAGEDVVNELGSDTMSLDYSLKNYWEYIKDKLLNEIINPLKQLSAIFGIIIVASVIRNLEKSTTIVDLIGISAVSALILPSVISDIDSLSEICSSVQVFMLAAFPVFTVLILASGRALVSEKYSELTLTLAYTIVLLVNNLIKPLLSVILGFGVSTSFSKNGVNRLPESIYKLVKWILILAVTIFSGVLSVTTAISGSYDAGTEKTAKLIASSAVPIIGSALGDGIAAVRQSVQIIKSGAGAFSILAIVIILTPYLIHMFIYELLCYIGITVSEIFGETGISSVLSIIMTIYKIICAVLICTFITVLVSSALLITIGT